MDGRSGSRCTSSTTRHERCPSTLVGLYPLRDSPLKPAFGFELPALESRNEVSMKLTVAQTLHESAERALRRDIENELHLPTFEQYCEKRSPGSRDSE